MRIIIEPDADAMSKWAAVYIINKIKSFNPSLQTPFVLGLPTGNTPIGTYKHLVQFFNQGKVSFKNVITFNRMNISGFL